MVPCVIAACAALAAMPTAQAYTLESAATDGCHELLASDAMRAVRASLPGAAPVIEPSSNDKALIDDLPFDVDPDMRELAAVSLLLGVRDNDLKGRGAAELDSLARVHGDPAGQREHCLRRPEHDEPQGSEEALQECRGFLRERFAAALDGLDASGAPDPAIRDELPVTLAIRGHIDASLPAFWVRIGQTMHAVQDGFTHTYRVADGTRITAVVNWVDVVGSSYQEGRDGPPHSGELDRCDDPDDLRALRRQLAIDASVQLLTAALDPSIAPPQRMVAAEEVLERFFTFEPGCTYDNGWCDAPERRYADDTGCACRAPASRSSSWSAPLIGAAALALARARRRARRGRLGRAARPRARILGFLAGALLLTGAGPAHAQDEPGTTPPADTTPPAEGTAAADAPAASTPPPPGTTRAEARAADVAAVRRAAVDPEPWRSAFGIHVAFSGAYDNLALAGAIGGRLRFAESWIVGLDAEYNPFVSLDGATFRSGVFNGYATLIRRWAMRYEPVNLRTTVNAGTSVLLMDLYGAPSGSVGIYVGASPLGIEWKVSRPIYVIVDPLNVALPVPQLSGVPFAYGQYRTTIGLEIDP